ncbi:MAG: cupin domain-containing protein [Nitrososphaerota archaeon]
MRIAKWSEVGYEEFTERGSSGTVRKTFVNEEMFRLRYYVVQPGGQTPFDIHDYEHVVIVVKGRGSIVSREDGAPRIYHVGEGDIIHIMSMDPHQFVNTGDSPFEFYCFSTQPSYTRVR